MLGEAPGRLQPPDFAANFLREFPVDELPYLAEHVHQHVKERGPDDEGKFALGRDLILDGPETIRNAAARRRDGVVTVTSNR